MSRKITIVTFSALLAAMFALGGCGSSQPASSAASSGSSSSVESSSSAEEEVVESDVVIGEEAAGAQSVVLVNDTGASIEGLAIASSSSEEEPVALMGSTQTWADGETATVYFEPQGSGIYDFEVTAGGETYVLHKFDADLIASASIHLEDGVAFVTYEQFGNEVSTQADESALAEEAAAAAEAEAAAAAEAEAAAAAEAEAEQTYTYDNTPTYNQPAQSGDACIDGGVALR